MRTPALLVTMLLSASAVSAQSSAAGPIIESAGAVFRIENPDFATPADMDFKVAFEVAAPAPSPDQLNVTLNSVARFLNMHAQAGVPRDRVQAAVVVHGPAGWEMVDDEAYRERNGVPNPNAALIRELHEAGVKVILCGQTAASRGIPRDRLLPEVQMALSAMTAFLVLQEEGFRVNPW